MRLVRRVGARGGWMQTAVRARVERRRIDIMLDVPIVEHFKALAGERGYQMINDTLRRILREELGKLSA